MAEETLTPTSYVVLALVGRGGAAPHDIAGMMRRSPLYWAAAPSQYYAEPKRLEQRGYLRSHKEPGRTHQRTVYTLTEQGLAALRDWLARPASFPRIQNEAAVRLLAGDLIGDAAIVQSLQGLREELDELSAKLDEAERIAETIPHRTRYLLLSHSLGRKLLAAHREWIEEIERDLGDAGADFDLPTHQR